MNAIDKLSELFKRFPGIGSRQAKRFVYFLLTQEGPFLEELARHIIELKKEVSQCELCYRYFTGDGSTKRCGICSDPHTDTSLLLVVEKDVDLENVRKTGVYQGRFFVLGGSLPILEQEPAQKIRAKELVDRVKQGIREGLKEVIVALSVNPEGENATQYVKKILEPFAQKGGLKVTALGRGFSTGTEVEYSDTDTLRSALGNRS